MLKRLLLFFAATVVWGQVSPAVPLALSNLGCATLILAVNTSSLCTVQMNGQAPADTTGTITGAYGGSTFAVVLTIKAPQINVPVTIPASLSAWSTDAAHPVSGGTLQVAIPGGQASATFTVAANGN